MRLNRRLEPGSFIDHRSLQVARRQRARTGARLVNRRDQLSALNLRLDRIEFQLEEAVSALEVLFGLDRIGGSEGAILAKDKIQSFVIHRVAHALQDAVLLRACGAFALGAAGRALDVIERLDRLDLRRKASEMFAFWSGLEERSPYLLRSLKTVRDRFVAHYDGRDIGDTSVKFDELYSVLVDYLAEIRRLRERLSPGSGNAFLGQVGVEAASTALFARALGVSA